MLMLKILAVSLALTLLAEGCFALAWGLRGRRELGLTALANCLTNPPVVLLHYTAVTLCHQDPILTTAVLECGAIAVEWRCYQAFSRQLRRPLLFSLLANAVSYGLGCFIQRL